MIHYLRLSLAEFRETTPDFLKQIKETGESIVLTIDGKAEANVQDIPSYRKMCAVVEEAETLEGIRQGLEDMKAGRTIPLDECIRQVREELGIDVRREES